MSLSAFFAQNAAKVENVKYIASERFTENGEPIEWEIRPITNKEDKELRNSCTKRSTVRGKRRNSKEKDFDQFAYQTKLNAACTVFPNLNDADLQDSYGVMGAEALLEAMLTPGELADYSYKVLEVCGFDTDTEELVEEAKN